MNLLERARQTLNRQQAEIEAQRQKEKLARTQRRKEALDKFPTETYPELKKLQRDFIDQNIPLEIQNLINEYSGALSSQSGHKIKRVIRFFYPSFHIDYEHSWNSKPPNLEDYQKEKIYQLQKKNNTKEKPTKCTIYYDYEEEKRNTALSLTITNHQTVQVRINSKQIGKDWNTKNDSDQIELATELLRILDQKSYCKLAWYPKDNNDDDDDYGQEKGDSTFGPSSW